MIVAVFWSFSNNWTLDTFSKQRVYGVLFSPVGSIIRATLSKYLNTKPRCAVAYPGTLIANIVGTFIGSINGGYVYLNGPYSSVILGALDLGVGGTMSTVSTYVKEVNAITALQEVSEASESMGLEVRGPGEESVEVYIGIMSALTICASIVGFLVGGWRVP